jgi:hypothetical protein
MKLTNLQLAAAGLLLFLLGAGSSYYLAPTKTVTEIKVETKTVVQWKEKESTKVNKDLVTVIVETKYPDGTIKTETRIVDKGTIAVDLSKEGNKTDTSVATSKTSTTRGGPQWRLSALATPSANDRNSLGGNMSYGVGIEKSILGPISAGVFGISNRVYGVSVSLSF